MQWFITPNFPHPSTSVSPYISGPSSRILPRRQLGSYQFKSQPSEVNAEKSIKENHHQGILKKKKEGLTRRGIWSHQIPEQVRACVCACVKVGSNEFCLYFSRSRLDSSFLSVVDASNRRLATLRLPSQSIRSVLRCSIVAVPTGLAIVLALANNSRKFCCYYLTSVDVFLCRTALRQKTKQEFLSIQVT